MTPSRFLVTPQVRALHGSRVDDFGAALLRSDVLADDVVLAFRALPQGQGWAQLRALTGDRTSLHPAIATFVDAASTTPTWVARETVNPTGALLLRAVASCLASRRCRQQTVRQPGSTSGRIK